LTYSHVKADQPAHMSDTIKATEQPVKQKGGKKKKKKQVEASDVTVPAVTEVKGDPTAVSTDKHACFFSPSLSLSISN
jgi:hypothetical protein